MIAVAAAGDSSYALTSDGRVFAWGENDDGQLGDGTTLDATTPIQVAGLAGIDIVGIAAGALPDGPTHALAVTADGHVYTWGEDAARPADPDQPTDHGNGNGGNGSGNGGTAGGPCQTKSDNGVGNGGVPGGGHANNGVGECSTKTDNGNGNNGTPGNGKGHQHTALAASPASGHDAASGPTLVAGLEHVVQVGAGGASSYALTADGDVYAWGDNSYGQLGLGTPPNVKNVDDPTQIPGLSHVKMVAAGGAHALALTTAGQVYGWGDDNTGQIGAPAATCREEGKICPSPRLIGAVTADAVAAGYVHTLIAAVDEHVDGLGRDAEGELGDGYTHPATQVGAPGDRNALDTPDGGVAGAKHDLTPVSGLAQTRPQAPVTASYSYDGDGLRASSTTTLDDTTTVIPATTTATYTWDTLSGLPALLSDGNHDYLTGPTGNVIEQTDVLGKPSTGGTVYLHADRLGSTRLLTNTNGQAVGTYTYAPTGRRVDATGTGVLPYDQHIPATQTDTPIGYAGAYTDPGTGLLYLQHRYDDPTTDQFLSVDPAVALTRQPYGYAGDDPVNLTDPEGATAGIAGCDTYDESQAAKAFLKDFSFTAHVGKDTAETAEQQVESDQKILKQLEKNGDASTKEAAEAASAALSKGGNSDELEEYAQKLGKTAKGLSILAALASLLANVNDYGATPKAVVVTTGEWVGGLVKMLLERVGTCEVLGAGPEDPGADLCAAGSMLFTVLGSVIGEKTGGQIAEEVDFVFSGKDGPETLAVGLP